MPMFNYVCPVCGLKMRKLLDAPRTNGLFCPKDKTELIRDFASAPSTQIKEILDNGLMPKQVERFVDAEKVYDDNSKHPKD